MANYTKIPDSSLESGAVLTQETALALRDNVEALLTDSDNSPIGLIEYSEVIQGDRNISIPKPADFGFVLFSYLSHSGSWVLTNITNNVYNIGFLENATDFSIVFNYINGTIPLNFNAKIYYQKTTTGESQ